MNRGAKLVRSAAIAVAVLLAGTGYYVVTHRAAAGPPGAFGDAPGERVHDFRFTDLDGERGRLSKLFTDEDDVVIVAMRDVGCPVAKRYGNELARIEGEYAADGVRFLYLNVNPEDDEERIREQEIDRYGLGGSYVRDTDGKIARLLGATTTEVFVIDAALTLRYRGAIDDQYGISFTKPEPRNRYLRDALDDVNAGRQVSVARTDAEGCFLDGADVQASRDGALPDRPITYHNRISRIVQNNCQTCHRSGGIAPFPLETYEQVNAYRPMIRYMVSEGLMPPWSASPDHGEWANDRSLPERDLHDLLAWIDAEAPEGDPGDAPGSIAWVDGWNIGEPDAVLEIPAPIEIPAEGFVDYQYVYVPTDFEEDRWVQSMELRPTAPEVTHHVLTFIEEPGLDCNARREPGDPVPQCGIDGFFAGTVPGAVGQYFPEGSAKLLPKGATLKFQLHYTPNGRATADRTRLGLVFADGPPERVVETASAWTTDFEIPAGAPRHEVSADFTFERPGTVLSFTPHMHTRGVAFRYDLIEPDGSSRTLLDIPRYDFNWQLSYVLAEPLEVQAGTRIRATGVFDNSPENPFNPDPTVEVYFGEQTYEEMMIGYFDWIPGRRDRPASGIATAGEL